MMSLSGAWITIQVAVEVAASHEPATTMFPITFENLRYISGKDGRTESLCVVPDRRPGIVNMGYFNCEGKVICRRVN
jgi:hypothetical protein